MTDAERIAELEQLLAAREADVENLNDLLIEQQELSRRRAIAEGERE